MYNLTLVLTPSRSSLPLPLHILQPYVRSSLLLLIGLLLLMLLQFHVHHSLKIPGIKNGARLQRSWAYAVSYCSEELCNLSAGEAVEPLPNLEKSTPDRA